MTTVSKTNKIESVPEGRGTSMRNGLLYLLAGGGIGAAFALLFAPKPGAKLRGDLADRARQGYDEAVEAVKGSSAAVIKSFPSLSGAKSLADGEARPQRKSDNVLELNAPKKDVTARSPSKHSNQRPSNGGRRSANIL